MTDGRSTEKLLRKWVEMLVSTLDTQVDDGARTGLMEACGRACALHYGEIEKTEAIKTDTKDIDESLDRLNQEVSWCGKWTRDGDTIHSVCQKCGCPLVRAGLIQLSPTFCNCSRGWVKAVFETALGRSVEVELVQAIGRGDPVCQFAVHPR